MRGSISKDRRWRWCVPFAVLALLLAACSSSASSQTKIGGSGTSGSAPEGIVSTTGSTVDGAVAPQPARPAPVTGGPVADAVPSDLLIVKTGTLALQVTGIDPAIGQASAKIAALGGYVSGSERSGDGESAVTRVDALVALRGVADKVVAEQTQSAEVTGEVLDLGALIANLQATERALQAIMDKAIKISDVLDVQNQLTGVRGQIEQLETEKKHLEEQSAYGTLDVTYGLETVAVVAAQQGYDPAGEVDRATASLVQVGQALATAGIWFAILWLPVILVLGIVFGVAFFVIRRVRRDRPDRPTGPIVPTATA